MMLILYVVIYLAAPEIKKLKLKMIILLQFVFIMSFLTSYMVIYSIMNYYDYHYLIVQPDK